MNRSTYIDRHRVSILESSPVETGTLTMRPTSTRPSTEVSRKVTRKVSFSSNRTSQVITLAGQLTSTVRCPDTRSSLHGYGRLFSTMPFCFRGGICHTLLVELIPISTNLFNSPHPPSQRNQGSCKRNHLRPVYLALVARWTDFLRPGSHFRRR
jgi:hypothetical protein